MVKLDELVNIGDHRQALELTSAIVARLRSSARACQGSNEQCASA